MLLEWLGEEIKEEKLGWFGVEGLTSSRPGNLACRLAQVTSVVKAFQLHIPKLNWGWNGWEQSLLRSIKISFNGDFIALNFMLHINFADMAGRDNEEVS